MRHKIPCGCDPEAVLNVGYGTGYRTVTVLAPHPLFLREDITLDVCLVEEVFALWARGIATRGCCCGHNLAAPFIQVDEDKVPEMIALGYKFYYYGGQQHDRRDAFYPLSLCPNE
jgi:hypothetical protein